MVLKFSKSENLLEKYDSVVPGGVHSNFRVPIYFREAKGSRIWDIDGNEFIDCVVNMGTCILGHGDAEVNEAVKQAVDRGLTNGLETELSLNVATKLKEMVPSVEQVRFANTGTEAIMKSIMMARAYTGTDKIIKLEGGYDGWSDDMQISVHPDLSKAGPKDAPTPVPHGGGLRGNVTQSTIPIPFNDIQSTEKIIQKNRREIAAVIVEPVMYNCGCILPDPEYLEFLRKITLDNNIVLIFDEVITGFRIAPGGAQEYYNIEPDLTVFAKAIANGYPLSAVVGKKEFIEVSHPQKGQVLYGGTYNAHQVSLAAASACLDKLADGKVQQKLNKLTDKLKREFDSIARKKGVKAQLLGFGGQFQVYFTKQEIKDYRTAATSSKEKYLKFQEVLFNEGIFSKQSHLWHHGVSYAHSEENINQILGAMEKGLEKVK